MHNGRGLKVVAADGDRTVLELLQIRLDIAGYTACIARSGPAVLEMLQNVRPGAMILDVGLPEIDGFEVLRRLNRRGEGLPWPTLVIGKRLSIEDIQLAMKLGARDCMVKPFSGADILERVARMLRPVPRQEARAVVYI